MTTSPRIMSASVAALLLTIFVDAIGWGLIFPSLTPLLVQNVSGIFASDVSSASRNLQFEWVVALYSIFMLMGAPLLGALSDQLGRRPVLLLCLSGSAISYACAGIGICCNSLALIIVSRIIGGITAGSMPIAQCALLDLSGESRQKAKYLSWVTLASNIGFACGPVLGALVLGASTSLLSYSTPFWLGGLLAIAGVLLIGLGFKETLTLDTHSTWRFEWRRCFSEFSVIVKDKVNYRYWLILALSLVAYSGFMAMLPIYFSHIHASSQLLGYSMTWFAICNGLSLLLLIPRCLPLLSLKTLVTIGLLGALVGNLLFIGSHTLYYLMTIITCVAVFSPFSYLGLVTLISNYTQPDNQGKVMGLAGSLMALSWIIAPLLAGVSTRYSYHLIYEVHAALLALCWLVFQLRQDK